MKIKLDRKNLNLFTFKMSGGNVGERPKFIGYLNGINCITILKYDIGVDFNALSKDVCLLKIHTSNKDFIYNVTFENGFVEIGL